MVILITFIFCKKEGIVGIIDLELLDVLMVGITDLDIIRES